jgi:TfoX/Sxy family transcriptional regulator of competence genes
MAFDEALADRVRGELLGNVEIEERRMFGGLAFLCGGHILIAASRQGGLLVRVESPTARDEILREKGVTPMVMGAKIVNRFVYVDASVVATKATLRAWIARSSTALQTIVRGEKPKKRKPRG